MLENKLDNNMTDEAYYGTSELWSEYSRRDTNFAVIKYKMW